MAIDDNASYELTGYQVKDLAGKVRAKADSSSLASVATSGLYSDLVGAPTIPTVYNGTLTIQQNGTQLGTFSANQSSNTTINITGGGGSATTPIYLYYDGDVTPARLYLYKDSAHTTPATGQDLLDNITAGNNTVCIDHSGGGLSYLTISISTDWSDGDSRCFYISGFGADGLETDGSGYLETRDDFIGVLSQNYLTIDKGYTLQQKLTAGSNIAISNNTISATDTTYSAFTGATSGAAGTSGLVPQPAAGDQDKYLKADGTWATVQAGGTMTTFYWNGPNSAMYKDSSLSIAATISDVETAASAGPVRIYFTNRGIYEYLVTDKINAEGYFSTVWATANGATSSVIYSYDSNTWDRTNVGLQKNLTAGSNITISGSTISATDTTYTAGDGISISNQNEISSAIVTPISFNTVNNTFSSSLSYGDIDDAVLAGENIVLLGVDVTSTSHAPSSVYFKVISSDSTLDGEAGKAVYLTHDGKHVERLLFANRADTSGTYSVTDLQAAMTGATSSVAGSAGLVPAPTTSDPDKFLKGDGTWASVKEHIIYIQFDTVNDRINLYKDENFTVPATAQDLVNNLEAGVNVVGYNDNNMTYLTVTMASDLTDGDSMYFYIHGAAMTQNGEVTGFNVIQETQDNFDTYGAQTYLTPSQRINCVFDSDVFRGATSSIAGTAGLVPAPAAGDQEKVLHGDGTWKDTTAKLVEMSYGESNAWAKFISAYNAGSIVYCRASSNANPASGSQTRKAFMAYVNNAANPTSVEFQYVRSVSSKTEAQPVDQVFVYTLTNSNGGTWSVASRNMGPKIAAGTGINVSYSNGTYTISLAS